MLNTLTVWLFCIFSPPNRPDNAFYLRPRPGKVPDNEPWYTCQPVRKETLAAIIGNLCAAAGFQGYYTNHSLRASAATRLYAAGVDEQLVCEKTGHRSNAVKTYKRTSTEQLEESSHIYSAGD